MTPETFTRLRTWAERAFLALTVAAFLLFACGGCDSCAGRLRDVSPF